MADEVINPYSDPLSKQAQWFVEYFGGLASTPNADLWMLGLYMAKQWARYIAMPKPDVEEIRLFSNTLKSERYNQGTGWHDMRLRVERWLASLEQEKTTDF